MVDDLLDVEVSLEVMGKVMGKDVEVGKVMLVGLMGVEVICFEFVKLLE